MADLIALYVDNNDMEAQIFATAEDALDELEKGAPQGVLLDLNLPGMSGLEFLAKMRADYDNAIPIVIVSALDSDEDIIKALDLGADEFVTKPFSPRVLVARLDANLRRRKKAGENSDDTISFDGYTLYGNTCVLKKGAEKIPLSAREFEVLDFLARNAGEIFSPEKIYSNVWKSDFGDLTAVAVYIQRLRKKIEKDPSNPQYIQTVFRQGYRFNYFSTVSESSDSGTVENAISQ